MWQYFRMAKSIKRDRVSDSMALCQSIVVSVGGGAAAKGITEQWEAILKPETEAPKAPPKRTAASKKAAIKRLASLFGDFG